MKLFCRGSHALRAKNAFENPNVIQIDVIDNHKYSRRRLSHDRSWPEIISAKKTANEKIRMKKARYFVPDISPIDRPELKGLSPRVLFVAESPHISEVEPGDRQKRRPLCGAAGRVWWKKLGEILEQESSDDVSLERMESICAQNKIAVINAVQFPMDPKVAAKYPDAEPVSNLGFAKASGEFSYKRQKKAPTVQEAVKNLRERLMDPKMKDAQIWPLGNDAEWFVSQALSPEEYAERVKGKIPHPSAWWRQGGHFGRVAQEKLNEVFSSVRKR
jgi:hypothetical protein